MQNFINYITGTDIGISVSILVAGLILLAVSIASGCYTLMDIIFKRLVFLGAAGCILIGIIMVVGSVLNV